ncbi:MAG: hypothetical protein ACI9XU_002059 [Arenicella sp.]|jgi:hypothetical protein
MLSLDDVPLPNVTESMLDMLSTLETVDGTPVKTVVFLVSNAGDEFWQHRVTYPPYERWSKGSITKYPELRRR